jgi:hypothetical protein
MQRNGRPDRFFETCQVWCKHVELRPSFCYNTPNDAFFSPGGAALPANPEFSTSDQPTPLATFEYRLAFSPPGRLPPDEWLEEPEAGQGEGDEYQDYHADQLWRQRSALRYLVTQETGRRLDERFQGLVSPQVEVRRGSLLVAVSLLLAAGVPLASFISQFPDYLQGLGLLKAALGQDVARATLVLAERENPNHQPQINAAGVTRSVNWPELASPAEPPQPAKLVRPAARPLPPVMRPPRTSLFKRTLQVLVLLLGFFWLLSEFQVTRGLLSGFFSLPDLRHQTVYLVDSHAASPGPSERLLFQVDNQGIGPAHDVLARLRIEGTPILEYQVQSDELYRVEAADLQAGELDIWLERLASGANFQLYVVTSQPVDYQQLHFSSVAEHGMGRTEQVAYYPGTWQDYRAQVLDGADPPSGFTAWARQAGLAQFWEEPDLRTATLVSAGLVFLAWLFVDGLAAVALLFVLAYLVSWRFVAVTLPASNFIAALVMALVVVVGISFERTTPLDRRVNEFVYFVVDETGCYLYAILGALLAILVFALNALAGARVPLHWLVGVFAALFFYFILGLALEDSQRRAH